MSEVLCLFEGPGLFSCQMWCPNMRETNVFFLLLPWGLWQDLIARWCSSLRPSFLRNCQKRTKIYSCGQSALFQRHFVTVRLTILLNTTFDAKDRELRGQWLFVFRRTFFNCKASFGQISLVGAEKPIESTLPNARLSILGNCFFSSILNEMTVSM